MDLLKAMVELSDSAICYQDTSHGMSMLRLKLMAKRLSDMWIPDELTMDDALNSSISNMCYNNGKCIELHLPVDGQLKDYNWRVVK
jgi:hypothetical protein